MNCIALTDVIDRLKGFGIDVKDSDISTIELIMVGTQQYIYNYCNISSLPPQLYFTAVDMCCGTFLKTKYSIGDIDFLDCNGDISSIKEGDVSLSFREGSSSSDVFKTLIDKLLNKKDELECFRKLKW